MPASLLITEPNGVSDKPIEGDGVLIGRHGECDVVLDSPTVSRRHARLYKDPFERWIIEDLGSRNGVWIGNEQVKSSPLPPGETVRIGSYMLSIEDESVKAIEAETNVGTTTLLYDNAPGSSLKQKAGREETLSTGRLKQLNRLIDRLAERTGVQKPGEAACQLLAEMPETVAMVLRLPGTDSEQSEKPQVLAFAQAGQPDAQPPHAMGRHVSRRVLEAVRTSQGAVMAGASRQDGRRMDLTVVNDAAPRAVLAAPIGPARATGAAGGGEYVDVLYLDCPASCAEEGLLDFVQAAARQIGFARKAGMLAEVRAERRALDRQIELAREIQANLTPACEARYGPIEVTVHYQPALWVGGDYCDLWVLPDGRLAVAVGDVCGKGLPAALVMMSLHAAMRSTVGFCKSLCDAVSRINHHVLHHTPDGMFATLVLAVLEPSTGAMQYVNAGHLSPLLVTTDRTVQSLGRPSNPPVGILQHDFVCSEHQLLDRTGLLIVTDGVTETASTSGEMFGEQRLSEALSLSETDSSKSFVDTIRSSLMAFADERGQQDDTTILSLCRV